MQPSPSPASRYDLAWLLLWGIASSLWCVTAAGRLSATFDEPFYIEQGLQAWRTGSNDRLMRAGTLTLPVDVETLPLYIWERCRGTPWNLRSDFGQMLSIARTTNLVFWWLLLFYGWRLGGLLGGPWGGRLTVALLASEPNLLAHASLATTDISVSACLLALVFYFQTGRDRGWRHRIGLPALWFGVAISAKASALTFGPLCMAAVEWHRLRERGAFLTPAGSGWRDRLRQAWVATAALRRDLWRIVPLGLVVVFLYCGTDWKPQKSFTVWAAKLPEGTLRDVMVPLSQNLRIFPNAGEALVYQIKHNIRGHGVYLFGDWAPRAVWYYFPSALLVKLSIPVLGLLLVLLTVRPRSLLSPAGASVLLLLLFSLNCRVQIGIRLVLPLVCLFIVSLGVGLTQLQPTRWPRRLQYGAVAAVLVAALLPAVAVWPNGLSYVNRLWGGTPEGFRYLGDSNYDWGQGLYELAEWQAAHPDRPLGLWYYGTDPRAELPPFTPVKLHQMPVATPEDLEPLVRGKYLAVGTSLLFGNPDLSPSTHQALLALHERAPIARTTTFFIYEFPD